MEIFNDKNQKLELAYPCLWSYRLISLEMELIQKAIGDILDEREHSLTHSKNSKGGKYVSMNLEMLVCNEEDRNSIYEALKAHQHIKMVL